MAKQSVAQRKAALLAELEKVEQQEREIENQKNAILGRIVIAEMEENPELKEMIDTLVASTLTKNSERELFGLAKLQSTRGRPKNAEIT